MEDFVVLLVLLKKRDTGEGTTVYSYYKESEDRN